MNATPLWIVVLLFLVGSECRRTPVKEDGEPELKRRGGLARERANAGHHGLPKHVRRNHKNGNPTKVEDSKTIGNLAKMALTLDKRHGDEIRGDEHFGDLKKIDEIADGELFMKHSEEMAAKAVSEEYRPLFLFPLDGKQIYRKPANLRKHQNKHVQKFKGKGLSIGQLAMMAMEQEKRRLAQSKGKAE